MAGGTNILRCRCSGGESAAGKYESLFTVRFIDVASRIAEDIYCFVT
jgi:hypothetical protein